jgi:hypothetical protein
MKTMQKNNSESALDENEICRKPTMSLHLTKIQQHTIQHDCTTGKFKDNTTYRLLLQAPLLLNRRVGLGSPTTTVADRGATAACMDGEEAEW